MELLYKFLDEIRQPVLVLFENNFFYANNYLLLELGFNRSKRPVSLVQILPSNSLQKLESLTSEPETTVEVCGRFGSLLTFKAKRFPLEVQGTGFNFYLLTNTQSSTTLYNYLVTILDDIPLPMLLMDSDLNITYLNMAAEEMKLIDEGSLRTPANFTSLFQTKTDVQKAGLELIEQIAVRTNSNKNYSAHLLPIKGELGQKVGMLCTLNEIISEQKSDILTTYEPIGIVTSAAIQNISNFLNIVMGQAELAKDRYQDLNEMDIIKKEINNIKQFLGKLDEKAQHYKTGKPETIDLNQLIVNEIEIFRANNFFKNRINLKLKLEKDLPQIFGNYAELSQAFIQLIHNAVEAMYQSQNTDFTISTRNQNQNIVCQIADSGIGISQVHLDRIFAPFYTTKSNDHTPFNSGRHLGLGLFQVQETLKKMEARCIVESKENEGAVFTLTFPAHTHN
jgi:signal transduction histidine kinase